MPAGATGQGKLTNWCGAKNAAGNYVNGPCTGAAGVWAGTSCTNNRVTKMDLSWKIVGTEFFSLSGGSIPTQLGGLDALTYLMFGHSTMSGTIPTELGRLTKLTWFWLEGLAGISGTIPTELGQLTKLTMFYMGGLGLQGTIPTELGMLSSLSERFAVVDLGLSGAVPASLCNLPNIGWGLGFNNNPLLTCYPSCLSGRTLYKDATISVCTCKPQSLPLYLHYLAPQFHLTSFPSFPKNSPPHSPRSPCTAAAPTSVPSYLPGAPTPAPSLHPVDLWVAQLTAASTGASSTVIAAHRTFYATLLNAGILSKIVRVNTFSGNDVIASMIPLLRGAGAATETAYAGGQNTNVGAAETWAGSYSPTGGLTGSGGQALSTGQRISHVDLLDTTSAAGDGSGVHMSIFFLDAPPDSCRPMGVFRGYGYSRHYLVNDGLTDFGWGSESSGNPACTSGLTVTTGTGAGTASRYVCSKGAASTCVASAFTGADRSQPSDWPVGIFGAFGSMNGVSTETATTYGICSSTMRVAGYTIGYALSSADVTTLTNAWNQLNADMSRT